MELPGAIQAMLDRRDLSADEMRSVMERIMSGQATPAQIGGFLVGLRMKGEAVDEIAAAAEVMRALCARVDVPDRRHLIDTCGTGGDGARTFNISTAAAFVVAAAGGRVAKHGNRSVSSQSGSADVLEAAGVRLDLTPEEVGRSIDRVGIGFLFAPRHHGAMQHAIGPRREMAVRTLFNMLGPLTNPAGAPHQLTGVFSASLLTPFAQVLQRLGSVHALIVHADDGLDEISLAAPTRIAELKQGTMQAYSIEPESLGYRRQSMASVTVGSPRESLALLRSVLSGQAGAARDVVALNAGAAIYAADLAGDLAEGVTRAEQAIASGAARERLEAFIDLNRAP